MKTAIDVRLTFAFLLIIMLFLDSLGSTSLADITPPPSGWTWKDASGNLRTSKDFIIILNQHSLWLSSKGKKGKKAVFDYCDLHGLKMQVYDLSDASFSHVNLTNADLLQNGFKRVTFSFCDLSETSFNSCVFTDFHVEYSRCVKTSVFGCKFQTLDVLESDFSKSSFGSSSFCIISVNALFNEARFEDCHLDGSSLLDVTAKGVQIIKSTMVKSEIRLSNFDNATFYDADLTDVLFDRTSLNNCMFEPSKLPRIEAMAWNEGLSTLNYEENPTPISMLIKAYHDGHFEEQERLVTYALNVEKYKRGPTWKRYLADFLFNNTCLYGLEPNLCLWILFQYTISFSIVYLFFIVKGIKRSGIYLVLKYKHSGKIRLKKVRFHLADLHNYKGRQKVFYIISRVWRVSRTALQFSCMSALNLGFREVDYGKWTRLLMPREYDMKALGWARTASGLQSLISLYLIGLWILCHLGNPFG